MDLLQNGVKLRQLQIFREVLRTGSTRQAAIAIGVSQPAVSQQIKQLELGLGLSLFERSSNRITPSRKAWELLRSVETALASLDRLEGSIVELRSEAKAAIAIAAPSVFGFVTLPNLVSTVRSRVSLSFRSISGSDDGIKQHILSGTADIGIARLPLDEGLFDWRPLATAGNVCLFHRGHRFSRLDEVTAQDLIGEAIIDIDPNFASHQMNINMLRFEGHEPDIVVEYDAVGHEAGFVSAGLGVSITNEIIAREYSAFPLAQKPFTPSAIYHYVAAWQKGRKLSYAADICLDALTALFRNVQPEPFTDRD
jgi:DNA-binding transcriptional LysR family regulator